MRRTKFGYALVALVLALSTMLSGCSASSGSKTTATFAGLVGEPPTYLFPMYPSSFWDTGYQPWASYLMWPALYRWGKGAKPAFNEAISLADPPVFTTTSTGATVATVTLKPRDWSDGQPVTTRDIKFWMNLLVANKAKFAPYVPGGFPDIVKKIDYLSSQKFQITFDKHYSSYWLLGNELTQITPIPQHSWDKTSANGKVGNYDTTTQGAQEVFKFLQSQAKVRSAFATNPMWQVVDGAWQIKAYNSTNSQMTLRPNPKYPWPQKQKITEFTELPFTSDAAELNALVSGQVDVGYVPLTSLKAIPSLEKRGYKISYWTQSAFGGLMFQYAKKNAATPILSQLYVRQALTHMLDMDTITKKIWAGRASYASGPMPNPNGKGQYVTAQERKDPYPFSMSTAKSLLTAHGWHVVPNGTSTCVRPGTASNECGAGIAAGAPLTFNILGTQSNTSEYQLLQYIVSSFTAGGVKLKVHLVPDANLAGNAGSCVGQSTCNWDMELWMGEWPLGWTPYAETGDNTFHCGSSSNYMNLCQKEDDRLIDQNNESKTPVKAVEQWENYMVKQQFQIYLPIPAYRVVAYKSNLKGVTPLDPYLQIFPENWYFTK